MPDKKNKNKFNPVWARPLGLGLAFMLAFLVCSSCASSPASPGQSSYSSRHLSIQLEQFQFHSRAITAAIDYYFEGEQKAAFQKRFDQIKTDFHKALNGNSEDRITEQINKISALHYEILNIIGPMNAIIEDGKIVVDNNRPR